MDESTAIRQSPRADSTTAASGDGIHDRWALHKYSFNYEDKPARFREYHAGRIINDELMEGYYDEFIPVVYDSDRGNVLRKEIEWNTTYCPECDVAARKYDGDTMCPECGLLCNEECPSDNLVRDPKAAGRVDNSPPGNYE